MSRKLSVIAMTFGFAFPACSGNGPPALPSIAARPSPSSTGPSISTPAKIKILNPNAGQIVHGTSLIVHVKVIGATIIPVATVNVDPYHGHVHIKLDGKIITIIASATYELTGLSKGTHLLYAEFVEGNHVPFAPRVIDTVTFTDS